MEKYKYITKRKEGEAHPTYSKTKEGQLDWSNLAEERPSKKKSLQVTQKGREDDEEDVNNY